MKPCRAAETSATASGKRTRIASRSATACSSIPPEGCTCLSAAAVSSTAVFRVSVANCSRCASCTDSACFAANSWIPRRRSSGSPPKGNPKLPSIDPNLAERGQVSALDLAQEGCDDLARALQRRRERRALEAAAERELELARGCADRIQP